MLSITQNGNLLSNFDRLARSVRMRLLEHYPAKLVWGVVADARLEVARLIPKIPNLGKGHIWQADLETSVMILALYRALKKYGASRSEFTHAIYDVYEAYLNSYPAVLHQVYRKYYFSQYHQDRLRRGATRSQLRRYPVDWVFTFVEGDGISSDFGIDIHECAILKFFRAQGVVELTPYICYQEAALGKILGLGFNRKNTLTNGATVCDCRWKLGAETDGDLLRDSPFPLVNLF